MFERTLAPPIVLPVPAAIFDVWSEQLVLEDRIAPHAPPPPMTLILFTLHGRRVYVQRQET